MAKTPQQYIELVNTDIPVVLHTKWQDNGTTMLEVECVCMSKVKCDEYAFFRAGLCAQVVEIFYFGRCCQCEIQHLIPKKVRQIEYPAPPTRHELALPGRTYAEMLNGKVVKS